MLMRQSVMCNRNSIAMPRGVKRGSAEGEAEVVVRAGESPSQTTLLENSPSQPISYHLLDHGYGATPKHQIRREAPTAPPKTSEVSALLNFHWITLNYKFANEEWWVNLCSNVLVSCRLYKFAFYVIKPLLPSISASCYGIL